MTFNVYYINRVHDHVILHPLVTYSTFHNIRIRCCYNSLQWHQNEHDGVSNHQLQECLVKRRSKKTSKLHVTGFCAGNSPVVGEFPAQKASNAENVSIWWRHHVVLLWLYYQLLILHGINMSVFGVALMAWGIPMSCYAWWRHQVETFSALLAICVRGIHRSPVNSRTKASDAELWCFLWCAPELNGWANNRKTGDLRCHRALCDVIVMVFIAPVR